MKTIVVLFMFINTLFASQTFAQTKPVTDLSTSSKASVIILTDKNFEATIKSGIVMVDFYATWCGPCKTLSPRIEEIAQETNKKIKICKVDTDKCPLASTKYNIKYLPTVIIFKNGEAVSRFVGLQEKETLVIALKAAQEK